MWSYLFLIESALALFMLIIFVPTWRREKRAAEQAKLRRKPVSQLRRELEEAMDAKVERELREHQERKEREQWTETR